MASMEDLIATINGGMQAGQQGSDLRDLHAKLAQTLHPTLPPYRPIPPQAPTTAALNPQGPMPPPAPASSWNSPPPVNAAAHNLFGSPSGGLPITNGNVSGNTAWGGMGNSPRQGGATFVGQRETGFNIVPTRNHVGNSNNNNQQAGNTGVNINSTVPPPTSNMPYHAAVLPVRASPKETSGFADDAFKPLWNGTEEKGEWVGFGRGAR